MLGKIIKFKYFILISIIFLSLRVLNLGYDHTNNDSVRWHNRTDSFLEALKEVNLQETFQRYHPGVTLMWLGAIPRQMFYVFQYNFLDTKLNIYSYDSFPYTNFFSMLSVILTIYVVIITQVHLIGKLWGGKTSLIYFFLISVEPYFVGINRWFHLTSLEVVLGFAAILSILVFLHTKLKKYFFLSAIFLGLSVLTKVTSLILAPIIFIVLVLYWKHTREYKVFPYYFLIYLLTIFTLFPALWVRPYEVSMDIFDSIFNAVGQDIRVYQLSPFLNNFFYFVVIPYKLSEITLLLIVLSFYGLRNKFKNVNNLITGLVFIFYLIFLSLSDQKIDRYSLVFFSPLLLFVANYLATVKSNFIKVTICLYLFFATLNFFHFGSNQSAFYNRLLGGTEYALKSGIYENGGNYFSEAAFYMNNNFPKETIFVPNNYESFSYFYNGRSIRDFVPETKYVVNSLDIDRITFNNYGCLEKVAEFGPLGYPVVAVFKCN